SSNTYHMYAPMYVRDCFFFFFQAEDGIRDFHVTGVQTCALPILRQPPAAVPAAMTKAQVTTIQVSMPSPPLGCMKASQGGRSVRSEERRVGKECRSR